MITGCFFIDYNPIPIGKVILFAVLILIITVIGHFCQDAAGFFDKDFFPVPTLIRIVKCSVFL